MKSEAVGQKIRKFRKRSSLSQFQLETEIGASPGSLSRIENGEVNPSKETLIKIIDKLNLHAEDAAQLFGIEIKDRYEILSHTTAALNAKLELNNVIQTSVDDIVFKLNFLAGFITLIEGETMQLQTTTQNWVTKVSMKFLPNNLKKLVLPMDPNSKNLCVQSAINKKIIVDESDMTWFLVPAVSYRIAQILKKVQGAKAAIVLPIIRNNKVLGTIFFNKNNVDDFSSEMNILKLYAEHVGIAIENARSYEELQSKLNNK